MMNNLKNEINELLASIEAEMHRTYESKEYTEEERLQAEVEFLGTTVDELIVVKEEKEAKLEECKVISLADKMNNLVEEITVTLTSDKEGDEMELMNHEVMLDNKEFDKKPKGAEIGAIQNRLAKSKETVSILDLADALTKGRSFKPCLMLGKSNDTFVSSSLIVLDIDNKGMELEEYGYKSIDSFLEDVKKSRFKPCLVYTTFSHSEECNKYRAVFQLDKKVTDFDYLTQIHDEIVADYPYADKKVHPAAVIFGGIDLIKLDALAVVKVDNFVFKGKKDKKIVRTNTAKAASITTRAEIINLTESDILNNIKTAYNKKFRGVEVDYNESFDWFNENIKLTDALNVSLDERFRCVLPDHVDEHPSARISDELEGGQRYMCSCRQGLKLLDVLALILNKDKSLIAFKIAEALGIVLGSEYQKKWVWILINFRRYLDEELEEYEVLNKYIKRRNLYGVYYLLIDFAMENVSSIPLNDNEDTLTFFVSNERISQRMKNLDMLGATLQAVNNKMNALKELGLIRALPDEEIRPNLLKEANKIRTEAALKNNNVKRNRVDYYELKLLSPDVVENAEAFITQAKEAGLKFTNNNIVRRAAAIGEEKTQEINVQFNVSSISNSKAVQKRMTKILEAAKALLDRQGYFTIEQLRHEFDPYRKVQKKMQIKYINDALPFIIKNFDVKEDRMKKSLCKTLSISDKIKTNTLIYIKE